MDIMKESTKHNLKLVSPCMGRDGVVGPQWGLDGLYPRYFTIKFRNFENVTLAVYQARLDEGSVILSDTIPEGFKEQLTALVSIYSKTPFLEDGRPTRCPLGFYTPSGIYWVEEDWG